MKEKGYTLIELIVVIILIGLMLGISVPRFRSLFITDSLKSTTRRLIGVVKELRNEAIRRQKTYYLYLDLGSNRFWVGFEAMTEEEREIGKKMAFQLPSDVRIVDVWRKGKGKNADGEVIITITKKGYFENTIINLGHEDGREFSLVMQPFLGTVKSYDRYIDEENI